MAGTDQQRVPFRQAYALVRRRQLMIWMGWGGIVLAFMLGTDRESGTAFGLPDSVTISVILGCFVAAGVLSYRNWRCPACHKPLGKGFTPTHCRYCGIELRAQGRAA